MIFKSKEFFAILFIILNSIIMTSEGEEDHEPVIEKFRSYLKIKTVHPNPESGYIEAVSWFKKQAEELQLDFNFVELGTSKDFALWLTWKGSDPSLKSILFNSHMDVVAATEWEKWKHPPFEAFEEENGNIYSRGATDDKAATVAQQEAIRRLRKSGFQPLRTIHLLIMPDEEKGSLRAMKPFIGSEHFKKLNVGVDIDEGLTNVGNFMTIGYTEKIIVQFNITARDLTTQHGATFSEYTAPQRLSHAINKIFEFRQRQYEKLKSSPNMTLEQVTTVNLVRMGGGIGNNVIPDLVWASFDLRMRVRPGWNITDVEEMLNKIVNESKLGYNASDGVTIQYIYKSPEAGETITNSSNVWWNVVQECCIEMNITCPKIVMAGATDGRFVRYLGISAFGISPFLNTPLTMHQDNEFINEREFLKGIGRYEVMMRKLAMLPGSLHP